ncbi:MAG: 2'-5' RNA ligase family protein, partial [Bacteroidota bacterium]
QGFRPHITIGFRDLKKATFYDAKPYYQERSFESSFLVNNLSLLRHDGLKWEVIRNFTFQSD